MRMTTLEKEIVNRPCSLGNEVLYELCREKPLDWSGDKKYNSRDALSAKMWLIGRSYSASPERRRYGKAEKVKFSIKSEGLDLYFDKLAEKMEGEVDYTILTNLVNDLRQEYFFKEKYDSAEWLKSEDYKLLTKSIYAVSLLNKLLLNCRFELDKADLKEKIRNENELKIIRDSQSNADSFCSKFLHFHAPNIVFIYDSISEQHMNMNGKKEKTFSFPNDEISEIKISNKIVKGIVNAIKTADKNQLKEFNLAEDDIRQNYIRHCVQEYILAYELKKRVNEFGTYIPRVVDTYVLMAN